MRTLDIDIETYSSVDLSECGVYKYSESSDFEILLFSYSADDSEVKVIALAENEPLPPEIIDAVIDNSVIKWAHNAQFERVCLSRWFKKHYPDKLQDDFLNPESWHCSMVLAAYVGLPLSLSSTGKVLEIEQQKLNGDASIEYFCQPCRPTKKNGQRTRNLPHHDPDRWEEFKKYNLRDVEVEIEIRKRMLEKRDIQSVWDEYQIDQTINDRGIQIDRDFVASALVIDAEATKRLLKEMKNLTELENPNSAMQLKAWLVDNGLRMSSLEKKEVTRALDEELPEKVKKVLLLRQQLSKSSIKKYQRMKDCVCADGRARGMFQFYGAGRTGRWAGRTIQMQNLPRNYLPDLEDARDLVQARNYDALEMLFEDIPDTLSQLIRTAFIPEKGHKFIIVDFSAIEARVLAWLANETWRLDAFNRNEDIYCSSAETMFHVPVKKHGINGELRQKGKIAELACGYGGSVGALEAMGALDMGLELDELQPLVDAWREANPNITKMWRQIGSAAKKAITTNEKVFTKYRGIDFELLDKTLLVRLPSGRKLSYINTVIEDGSLMYDGLRADKKWGQIETRGSKLVENIVQATSRDLLAHAMKELSAFAVVMHVHDEIVVETDETVEVEAVVEKMKKAPTWAAGLPLNASGFESNFYRKE